MYQVDGEDRVRALPEVPQSSVGAPLPLVVGDGHCTILAYYMQQQPPSWDGTSVRLVDPSDSNEPIAIIRFAYCHAHMLGPPNDEAFQGHPLATRGLEPYGAFEVEHSSWVRRLERMNSVHPYHRPEAFLKRRHLIFSFHDETFECVCDRFDITLAQGSIESVVPAMLRLLEWTA